MSAAEKITEAEAAHRLGISKATLARERLRGHIRPIRIGPRVRMTLAGIARCWPGQFAGSGQMVDQALPRRRVGLRDGPAN